MTTLLESPPRLPVVRETETTATLEPTVVDKICSAIALWESGNNLLLDAGRILAEVKAGNKKKFSELMTDFCLEKNYANKLVQMADVADVIPSNVAPKLGIHMLLQLRQSRNEQALDSITHEDTQLSVASKIKELKAPATPKKQTGPVSYVRNIPGGGRKLRIEVIDGDEAVAIERDWRDSGLPPHQWLFSRIFYADYQPSKEIEASTQPPQTTTEAITEQHKVTDTVPQEVFSASENPIAEQAIASEDDNMKAVEEIAPESDITSDQTKPSPVSHEKVIEISSVQTDSAACNTNLEQETAQAELNQHIEQQAEEIAPEALINAQHDLNSEMTAAPCSNVVIADTTQISYPCVTPTDRFKKGWKVGDKVVANTTVPSFANKCSGQEVTVVSVDGEVGSIQILYVLGPDGERIMAGGNWVEQPQATPAPNGEALEKKFYKVGATGNEWEGEIVQVDSKGPVLCKVSSINDSSWTQLKHEDLEQEVSLEQVTELSKELSDKILAEYKLKIGDKIQWTVEGIRLTGTIKRLTKLGAFIDEGQPGLPWIKYHRISKVQPIDSASAPETDHADQHASVVSNENLPPATLNYKQLSQDLKNVKNWQEIEQMVSTDSTILTKAVKDWNDSDKNELVGHLNNYLELETNALVEHQLDWLPLPSLEKSLKNLSFKVKNIMEGMNAPWQVGCQFLKVENYNTSDEIWTFKNAASEEIKVCERKDFQVIALCEQNSSIN